MKQSEALKILKTGANVFLTGEPGSGKTHTINTYISYLRDHGVEPAVTASTGIAATHIGGSTIHSWSGIGVRREMSPYDLEGLHEKRPLVERIRNTDVLIIDEISMLDAALLDLVDTVIRTVRQSEAPFGGMQVVFIGDFFQLPPISRGMDVSFAYMARSWKAAAPVTCYLREQYRQTDARFCSFLSALRSGSLEDADIELLEERVVSHANDAPYTATLLYSHNADVDRINEGKLEELDGKKEVFDMESHGNGRIVEQLKRGCLSPEKLELKEGAVVMCTKNNFEKGFVNGTVGTVVSFEKRTRYPVIETRDGTRISVSEMEWTVEEEGKVLAKITQIPLRLAWAITVHKSQGVSLDSAVVDLSRSFEYGQGYVALSRIRSFEGLFCLGYNRKALEVHPEIRKQDGRFERHSHVVRERFRCLTEEEVSDKCGAYLEALGGTIKKGARPSRKKGSTYDKTAECLKTANTLAEVAEQRGLTLSTVLTHCERLADHGTIAHDDIERFWRAAGRSTEELTELRSLFLESESKRLTPIFKEKKGEYSYEELRLARLGL